MRRPLRFPLAAALCLPLALSTLVLSGCGGDDIPPPEAYAPMHFDYLPKIRLNVGTIQIVDHARPLGPNDIAGQSPLVPSTALTQMAHDRLFAAGFAGTAVFTIDQASIVQGPNGTLSGTLAVHLDVSVPGAAQTGFAAAQVQRQHISGSDAENLQNNLYDLTRDMVDAMNVELEFQIKKSLSAAMTTGPAMPAPVEAQPLDQGVPPAPPIGGAASQTLPTAPPVSDADPGDAQAAPAPVPQPAMPPPPPPPAAPPPASKYRDPLSPALTAPAPPAHVLQAPGAGQY